MQLCANAAAQHQDTPNIGQIRETSHLLSICNKYSSSIRCRLPLSMKSNFRTSWRAFFVNRENMVQHPQALRLSNVTHVARAFLCQAGLDNTILCRSTKQQ